MRIIWSKVDGVLVDFLPDLLLGISQLLDNQYYDMTLLDATMATAPPYGLKIDLRI